MAKDLDSIAGQQTMKLKGVTNRGRKPKGERPMTNAERQRAFRAKRLEIETSEQIGSTIKRLASDFEISKDEVINHLLRFALCNRNWNQTGFPTARENKTN
jgi:hypothetical protein